MFWVSIVIGAAVCSSIPEMRVDALPEVIYLGM